MQDVVEKEKENRNVVKPRVNCSSHMSDLWTVTTVEPLDDKNYFLWSEKVEGILRSKKLWKKVIGVKPKEKPVLENVEYERKQREWNDDWDDDNYTARSVMINTMSRGQILKYSSEKNANKLWTKIKLDMAAESKEQKTRSLNELTNLKMEKNETVNMFINRAEALANQCIQLGKNIEQFEFKMYIERASTRIWFKY